jgi:hypothetical protein
MGTKIDNFLKFTGKITARKSKGNHLIQNKQPHLNKFISDRNDMFFGELNLSGLELELDNFFSQ